MVEPRKCPECGAFDTERVYSDFENYQVVEIRVCNECPTEYQVTYADPMKETTHTDN